MEKTRSANRSADDHRNFATTRQVAIGVAFALIVGTLIAPIAVNAAQALNALITDPVNQGLQARVDNGALRVGDGEGAMTVDGTVTARPGLPAKVFQKYVRLVGPGPAEEAVFGPAQPGAGLAISSLTIRNQGANPVEFHANLFTIPERVGCDFQGGGGVSFLLQVRPGPQETIHLPFPQPLLVTSAGERWCLIFQRFGDETLDVTVVGSEM